MHCQDPGVERQQLPGAVAGGVGVEFQQLIQAGVLLGGVVDHERDQLAGAAELGGGEATALVLVGEPVRHPHPPSPAARRDAVGTQVLPGPVEGLVLPDGVVDLHDDQVAAGTVAGAGHGDPTALVVQGEPVGHADPWRPTGDAAVGGQAMADPAQAGVLLGRVVDHEDDQVVLALTVGRRHRHGDTLVLVGEPVRDRDPRCPAAGEVAVAVQAAADPEQPLVLARRGVHHRHHQVLAAVVPQVGEGDAGPLVLMGEPLRDRHPGRPTGGDGPGAIQGPPDPEQALVLPLGTVDQEDHEVLDAIAGQACRGDPTALIFPGEPVGHADELVGHRTTPSKWEAIV